MAECGLKQATCHGAQPSDVIALLALQVSGHLTGIRHTSPLLRDEIAEITECQVQTSQVQARNIFLLSGPFLPRYEVRPRPEQDFFVLLPLVLGSEIIARLMDGFYRWRELDGQLCVKIDD